MAANGLVSLVFDANFQPVMNCYPVRYYLIPIVFLLAVCCLIPAGYAQSGGGSGAYVHYDISNGLPSNNVYSTLQDHNGYIWLATDKGAVRFNGYDFRVFTTADGLPANDVYRLQEDSKGRIWVYTLTTGFGYLQDDKYHSLHFQRRYEGVLYPGQVREYNGYVYFTYRVAAINYAAFLKNDSAIVFSPSRQEAGRVLRGAITGWYIYAGDGFLSVFSFNNENWNSSGLFVIELNKYPLVFRRVMNIPQVLMKGIVYQSINSVEKEHGWINIGNENLFSFDPIRKDVRFVPFKRYYFSPGENLYVLGRGKGVITNLYSTKKIYFFNRDFSLQRVEFYRKGVFEKIQVSYLDEDRNGKKWYSTNTAGLWMYMPYEKIWYADSSYGGLRRLKGSDDEYSFWYDSRFDRLILLDTAGIKINGINALSSFVGRPLSVLDNGDYAIYGDGGFVGCNPLHGTKPLNQQRKTYFLVDDRKCLIPFKPDETVKEKFFSINLDAINTIAGKSLCLQSYGVSSYKKMGDTVAVKTLSNARLSHIIPVLFDRRLFIAYNNEQLFIYNAVADTGTLVIAGILSPALVQLKQVATDASGHVFILAGKGLYRYDVRRHQLLQLPVCFNLENVQMNIHDHSLLLAGNFGIAAARISATGEPGEFYCLENIGGQNYRQVTELWVTRYGRVFANTDKGLLHTSMMEVFNARNRYSIRHTPFELVLGTPYNRALRNGDTIQLDHVTKLLSFDAINFLGQGERRYMYTISGLYADRQQTKEGEVLLPDLNADRYYHLQLSVGDAAWQSGMYDIVLYRPPYWYQSHTWKIAGWIGLGILLLLSGLGVFSVVRYIATRAQLRRQLMNDLELRAIHSQINPHFIFNTLSTALYFISRKEYDNAYGHVNKFSHLLRAYLKSSHDRYVLLAEEVDMLRRYVELQQARFEERFTYTITIDNKLPAGNIQIPSLLLQPLVENAINHGLFHKKEPGWLKIDFTQGNSHTQLICTIEDNGVGREQAKRIKQESAVRKESFGTKLTEKLVRIFRDYEEMEISIRYTDKKLPETGTIVTLVIDNVKYVV